MTTKQGMLLLGRKGMLRDRRGLSIPVRVIDSRQVFGRVDVLVEPVSGEGAMWVAERTLFQPQPQEEKQLNHADSFYRKAWWMVT